MERADRHIRQSYRASLWVLIFLLLAILLFIWNPGQKYSRLIYTAPLLVATLISLYGSICFLRGFKAKRNELKVIALLVHLAMLALLIIVLASHL